MQAADGCGSFVYNPRLTAGVTELANEGAIMPSESSDYSVTRTTRLVKGEDLNHHETLYAGRCAEWSVQMAYITAQSCFAEPTPLVFMSIRNLSMRNPTRVGDLVEFTGRVDYVGESTLR